MRASSRADSAGASVLALAIALAAGTGVSAHRCDEYLQAARIALQPDSVSIELNLTPGMDVADSIITTIDRNRDGALSADERQAYATEVLRALEIELDGRPLALRVISSNFPDLWAFRAGEGTMRLQVAATHPRLSAGAHQLLFRNSHMAGQSANLANELVPDNDRVSVTAQRRDSQQRDLTIDYAVRREFAVKAGWLLVILPFAALLAVRVIGRSREVRPRALRPCDLT